MQGFNAQAAVDSQTQVIVAAEVTQQTNDSRQLIPMIEQVLANTGSKPIAVSADAGYWSEANVTDKGVAGVDLHIATGRQKHGEKVVTATGPPAAEATPKEATAHKPQTEAGKSIYKMRQAIVEPVFGQIKERREFRRQLPRVGQCRFGVEADLPDGQYAEAIPLGVDAANTLTAVAKAVSARLKAVLRPFGLLRQECGEKDRASA